MPQWVNQAYGDYVKRIPHECELVLKEIAPVKRSKNEDVLRMQNQEGERILAAVSRDDHVIALEIHGKPWSTPELSENLRRWMFGGKRIALLVGGPDGLAEACKKRANEQWSLSPLTLPHPIVRVLVAEQIYRASSILQNHPYHR